MMNVTEYGVWNEDNNDWHSVSDVGGWDMIDAGVAMSRDIEERPELSGSLIVKAV